MPHDRDRDATGPGIIDIWTWSLDAVDPDLAAMLSSEEIARASRFVQARDCHRFIAGRAGLRRILARYLAVAPRRLGLTYNAFGKPQIAGSNRRQLHFNLSHTETTAMLAVSDHYHVGIDIETIKPLKEDIAGHFFSPKEYMTLKMLAPEAYLQGFYCLWTRKEAFLKALGVGLSLPLDAFDIAITAPQLERLDGDADAPINWSLFDVDTPSGLVGTVAALTVGNSVRLRYRTEENDLLTGLVARQRHNAPLLHRSDDSPASPS
ncbi:4'-phosphopantetheinyl transferase family protein [Rhizobium sullae]|uniref:4'-phosphopantetheinyl transferase family protein n=1 Tax=Rhizobium sullae TaxID=50338 RepID=UPI000B350250|nr:4'-phosphopantetheinyl transferase superfamily protein [Rhizobium sullae]